MDKRLKMTLFLFIFLGLIAGVRALEIGTSTGSLGVGGSRGVVLAPPTDISFLWLNDTPDSYAGNAGNCIKVNGVETELEFGACGAGGGGDPYLGYYNSSLINTTTLEDQAGKLSIKESWLVSLINSIVNSLIGIHESTFKHGNTTAEIEALDSFNTTLEMETAINTTKYYQIKVNYSNVLNHPADQVNTTQQMRDAVNHTYLNFSMITTSGNATIGNNLNVIKNVTINGTTLSVISSNGSHTFWD